jgi:hypothetical protein
MIERCRPAGSRSVTGRVAAMQEGLSRVTSGSQG